MYTVRITPAAERAMKKFPKPDQEFITKHLAELEQNPRPRNCIKMEAPKNLYRIRAGRYRIIYEIRDKELWILITKIDYRRDIYRTC